MMARIHSPSTSYDSDGVLLLESYAYQQVPIDVTRAIGEMGSDMLELAQTKRATAVMVGDRGDPEAAPPITTEQDRLR